MARRRSAEAEDKPAYMQVVEDYRKEQEEQPMAPTPPTVASKSRGELIAEAFDALAQSSDFKQNSEALAKDLRMFLMKNCQIELSDDPATFVEQIRSGVGFPRACSVVADLEYVFDAFSHGSLSDGLKKRLNELL